MGISFKICKNGTRYHSAPPLLQNLADEAAENSKRIRGNGSSTPKRKHEGHIIDVAGDLDGIFISSADAGPGHIFPDNDTSFTLDLFPEGFSIGKPVQNEKCEPLLQEVRKPLYPYNTSSEGLFSAIESGRLPGSFLDGISCKYHDGSLVCEVRDYRKCVSSSSDMSSTIKGLPVISKVHLQMSYENIVKDMPSISDDSWTYGDLMEVESRILKAVQPQLYLHPKPMMDRFCTPLASRKLDLGECGARGKRLRRMAEVIVTSNNQVHGKKVSIDRIAENTDDKLRMGGTVSGDATLCSIGKNSISQPARRQTTIGHGASGPPVPLMNQPSFCCTIKAPVHDYPGGHVQTVASTSMHHAVLEPVNSCNDNLASDDINPETRENLDKKTGLMSGILAQNQATTRLDGTAQQLPAGCRPENLCGFDAYWRSPISQPQMDIIENHLPSTDRKKYVQQTMNDVQKMLEMSSSQDGGTRFHLDHRGTGCTVKEERIEADSFEKQEVDKSNDGTRSLETEKDALNQQQKQLQEMFIRSHFSQTQWQNLGTLVEKDPKRDDLVHKRKSAQNPHVSNAVVTQSPVSSKSGEISSGSYGGNFHTVAAVTTTQGSQKGPIFSGAVHSVASGPNDCLQRQHQGPAMTKWKPNSLPKAPVASVTVASPASVSNVNVPLNASSPSAGAMPAISSHPLLERFTKIDAVTVRYQLNCKNCKTDDINIVKPLSYSTHQLSCCLSNAFKCGDFKDASDMNLLSKSLIGGSMNISKSRVITFMHPEHVCQGDGVSYAVPKSRNRLVLLERPYDDMVAMHHGDVDETDFLAYLDYLPKLPNSHFADLLAAQFCSLMLHDGFQITEEQIRPVPMYMNTFNGSGISHEPTSTELPIIDTVGQSSVRVIQQMPPSVSMGSAPESMKAMQNIISSPGATPSMQMSQGYINGGAVSSRPLQHLDQTSVLQPESQQIQHFQHPQVQRTSLSFPNSFANLGGAGIGQNANLNLVNPMVNKSSHLQLQMIQQQQQQQQPKHQSPLQRKMMMGLGASGMGNSLAGLSGFGNIAGLGCVQGLNPGVPSPVGMVSGMSAPMGVGLSTPTGINQTAGLRNVVHNTMNLNQVSNITNVLNQHIRSGTLSHAQAAAVASRLRMVQSRVGMLSPQSGISGLSGNGQMQGAGLSVLGQTLNRANTSPQHRASMTSMGPPRNNLYINQPQHQLQQWQQQLQPQAQPIGSPLQGQQIVVTRPQDGSPSAVAIQPQLAQQKQHIGSPQVSQHNPMSPQLSGGGLQHLNNVNAGAGPASPQLSSQTLGSIGSISSSPMELQGVNKANSVSSL